MGRAMRWIRRILGGGTKREAKDDHDGDQMRVNNPNLINGGEWREKRRWSFVKPGRSSVDDARGGGSSASFAAAATAAAAARVTPASSVEIAAANRECRKARAAIVIQKVFRGYLARKALRALKALVKIQALVRGYLVRKQTATTLHRLQALVRLQISAHSHKSLRRIHPRVPSRKSFLGVSHESPTSSWERSPKIVEVDTCQPLRSRSARMACPWAVSSPDAPRAVATASSPLLPTKPLSVVTRRGDDGGGYDDRRCLRANRTAQNTPRHAGGTCDSAAVTPVPLRRYPHRSPGRPSYMSDTCSSVARSRSAPRQRPDSAEQVPFSGLVLNSGSGSGTNRRSCSQVRDACSSNSKGAEVASYMLISTELLARDYYLDRMW